ncbi:MAG: cupin domain-containing protein [Planctomycetes bacterium]|nr:cupin domain-containing protein [Planctomycetota bacterium]
MAATGLRLDVDGAGVAWRDTKTPGVQWCLLASEGRGERAGGAVLIRMEPGCGYPAHEHLGPEEVLILAGGYRDHLGEHRAGEYLRYEPGTRHAPVALGDPGAPAGPANPACLLYAVSRGGIRTLGDEEAGSLG